MIPNKTEWLHQILFLIWFAIRAKWAVFKQDFCGKLVNEILSHSDSWGTLKRQFLLQSIGAKILSCEKMGGVVN